MKNANVGSEKIVKVRRMAGVPVRSGVKAGGIPGGEFGRGYLGSHRQPGGGPGGPGRPGRPGGRVV